MRTTIAIMGLLLLTGCASNSSSNPPTETTPSAPAQAKTVSVHKTGGIAGIEEALTVDAEGAWTLTTRSDTKSGQLTKIQVQALQELLAKPRLQDEAGRTVTDTNCADTFNYTVKVDTLEIKYNDCPTDEDLPMATMAIVAYLDQIVS